MESSRMPFMAPLVCDPCLNILANEESWWHSSPGSFVSVMTLCVEEVSPPQCLALWKMAERGSNYSAGATTDGSGGRFKRGSGSSSPKKTTVEVHQGGGGEANPGERWFNLETSPAERRALFHLEREMDATLLFKYRGNRRASQLWVTRILLGRLF